VSGSKTDRPAIGSQQGKSHQLDADRAEFEKRKHDSQPEAQRPAHVPGTGSARYSPITPLLDMASERCCRFHACAEQGLNRADLRTGDSHGRMPTQTKTHAPRSKLQVQSEKDNFAHTHHFSGVLELALCLLLALVLRTKCALKNKTCFAERAREEWFGCPSS
jgi:hypothetical protein